MEYEDKYPTVISEYVFWVAGISFRCFHCYGPGPPSRTSRCFTAGVNKVKHVYLGSTAGLMLLSIVFILFVCFLGGQIIYFFSPVENNKKKWTVLVWHICLAELLISGICSAAGFVEVMSWTPHPPHKIYIVSLNYSIKLNSLWQCDILLVACYWSQRSFISDV